MDIGGKGSIGSRIYIHEGRLLVFSTVLLDRVGRVTLASHGVFDVATVGAELLGSAARQAVLTSRPVTTTTEFEAFAPDHDPLTEALGLRGKALEFLVRNMRCGQVVVWEGSDEFTLAFDGVGALEAMNRSFAIDCSDLELGEHLLAGLALR